MHSLLTLLAPVLDPIVRIDFAVVHFFNQFANHSLVLDRTVALVEELFVVKGALFMAAMYWLWFLPSDDIDRDRIRILRGFAGTMVAIAVTLTLDHFLPNRPRPLNEPALGFVLPTGSYDTPVADNSFPSDHGAMFFAVSTIIWLRSRRWGIVAYIYTVLVIFLPRIYAGHHYPSDLIAGSAIGAFFVWLAISVPLMVVVAAKYGWAAWIKFALVAFVFYGIAMLFTHPTTVPTRATTPKPKTKPQPATA